jgi:NitT/TauT family transport system substrate-binding protein
MRYVLRIFALAIVLTMSAFGTVKSVEAAPPITIGYSDWPGWTSWDIVDQMGFFAKHHCNVKLVWFANYTDSLNAFAAKKLDSNCQTWSDSMGPIAAGQQCKVVLINDNSAGNDAIVAGPGINTIADLRGKKVATELGTCDQFLLDEALAINHMTEADIHYVPIDVQDCPAAMLAHRVDAVVVWEPNKSQLLTSMKGSHVIFDSRKVPGLIPDLLVFQKSVADSRPQDIQNIVDAWYDMLGWWRTHPQQACTIMAKRTDSPISFYTKFITGTRIFSGKEAIGAFTKSKKITSLYTSGAQISSFLLTTKQVPKAPDYLSTLDGKYTKAAVAKGLGVVPPYAYTTKVN